MKAIYACLYSHAEDLYGLGQPPFTYSLAVHHRLARRLGRWCYTHPLVRIAFQFVNNVCLFPILTLADKELGKYINNPKMKIQKLENCQKAFKFLEGEGIPLVNIVPEDIMGKKLPLILGFVWTLILRYHIQKGGVGSAKNELLGWVQSKIPHKNVTNFTSSWKDGTAICELVQALFPGQIDCQSLHDDRLANATLGADLAEMYMNIPKVLAPEDMAGDLQEELSIMTYVCRSSNDNLSPDFLFP